MIEFTRLDPRLQEEDLGLLPHFLSETNPASAKEQINANYSHGGGWHSFKGFEVIDGRGTIKYPGDAPLKPLAEAKFRDDTMIRFYSGAWVAIFTADGGFDICRID